MSVRNLRCQHECCAPSAMQSAAGVEDSGAGIGGRLSYPATHVLCDVRYWPSACPYVLRLCYAMSGNGRGYAAPIAIIMRYPILA
eukprot:3938029-Rhodomonas_salina.1